MSKNNDRLGFDEYDDIRFTGNVEEVGYFGQESEFFAQTVKFLRLDEDVENNFDFLPLTDGTFNHRDLCRISCAKKRL